MELRDYQKRILNEIDAKLLGVNKLCVQLATGGGKTIIFTEFAKNYKGSVLILVDSKELIEQTVRNFTDASTFEAKDKTFPNSRIVIAMADTVWSRLKTKPEMINHFDILIIDECHIWKFNKIFDYAKNAKVLGFTATPVRAQRESFFDDHGIEWTREQLMSDVYEDIVCGIDVADLINEGFLVDEESYKIPIKSFLLEQDSSGEFTNDSINKTIDNDEYKLDVLTNYNQYCKGKKTMIFTANTQINLSLFNAFNEAGIENIKFYDSVNKQDVKRSQIVKWFRDTPGAILFNVGVFTKGFDVKDVEAIILARPTTSLSLFIQIAGRGSRTTDANQVFKDRFIFIDGGGNIDRFNLWSFPRDWNRIFFNGLHPAKPKRESLEDVKECKECGGLVSKSSLICPECGEELLLKKAKELVSNNVVAEIAKPVYPNADKIIKYAKSQNEDAFFALRILNNQIFDLFLKFGVSKELYEINLANGKLMDKLERQLLKQNYRKVIFSELKSNANRTYEQQVKLLKNKLDKYYGKI